MPLAKPLPVIIESAFTEADVQFALAEVRGYLEGRADVLQKVQADLNAIQARTDLSEKEKRLLVHRQRAALHKERRRLQDSLDHDTQWFGLNAMHDALNEIIKWADDGVVFQAGAGNPVPEVAAAVRAGKIVATDKDALAVAWLRAGLESVQTFAMEHDWAKAFAGATDFDGGEIVMPAASTAFAFRLSGRRVVVMLAGEPLHYAVIPETRRGWTIAIFEPANLTAPTTGDNQITAVAWRQIRAACIMLDAEIAERQPQRAPFFPEASSLPSVPLPLFDYHVLSLARRDRTAQTDGEYTGNKRRLHFRRGHWRHYVTFKTWVRWTLVGNPDLGFVDKEYRL